MFRAGISLRQFEVACLCERDTVQNVGSPLSSLSKTPLLSPSLQSQWTLVQWHHQNRDGDGVT